MTGGQRMPRRWTELPLLVLLSAACQAPIEPDPDRDPIIDDDNDANDDDDDADAAEE